MIYSQPRILAYSVIALIVLMLVWGMTKALESYCHLGTWTTVGELTKCTERLMHWKGE